MIPSVKCSLGNMLSHGCPVCILLCACNIRRYSSAQYICSKTSNDVSTIQLAQWNSSLCSETQTFLSSYNSTLILYRTTLKVIVGGGSVLLIVSLTARKCCESHGCQSHCSPLTFEPLGIISPICKLRAVWRHTLKL